MITNILKGSKVFHLLWIFVFLGSCTYIQTTDNHATVFVFGLENASAPSCGEFQRTTHLKHYRPAFPKVDITQLAPEEREDLLLSYTEKLKVFLDNEDAYLKEDIARHNQKCKSGASNVFQK